MIVRARPGAGPQKPCHLSCSLHVAPAPFLLKAFLRRTGLLRSPIHTAYRKEGSVTRQDHAGLPDADLLQEREQLLWDRQQLLLDSVVGLWRREREEWAAREAAMLAEMTRLRQELKEIILNQPEGHASSRGQPPSSSSSSVEGTIRGGISTPTTAQSTPSAAVSSVVQAVWKGTDSSTSSSDAGAGSWEGLFKGVPINGLDSSGSSVTSALTAADETDVLSGSFDSMLKEALRTGGQGTSSNSSSRSAGSDGIGNGVVTPTSSAPSSGSAGSGGDVAFVEVVKAPKDGPPPVLVLGDDDIFWCGRLHELLMGQGYYPSDDDVENWFFGETTQTALLAFQACEKVPETGMADAHTWSKLLGQEVTTFDSTPSYSGPHVPEEEDEGVRGHLDDVSAQGGWPVVRDLDGGREVHALQVALSRQGYNCGDDDMRWWQFGEMTLNALKTFQACCGLPESGVCDERTWVALLGEGATPEMLQELRSEEFEDDMTEPAQGAVWLLGEQRWSNPSRTSI